MSIKSIAGSLAAAALPNCRFEQSIFLLGHMRCGSTALSKVICNHPQVSGYGEAHIAYVGQSALGVLALNQIRRHAFHPGATRLFDKILHSRYDVNADPEFFHGSAVFLIRSPIETIRSIRKLFSGSTSREFASDAAAVDYYEERLTALARLWERFPSERRFATTYSRLTADPDAALADISARLQLDPPLGNRYGADTRAQAHGAGDPLSAHRFDRIVASDISTTLRQNYDKFDVEYSRIQRIEDLFYDISSLMVDDG